MPFVQSNVALTDVLAAIIGNVLNATGPVNTHVKLAVLPFNPTPTSDPTTFTEATFDGYAAKAITSWSTPYFDALGNAKTLSGVLASWTPTGSTTANTIGGYWLVAGDGTYLGGEVFNTPVPMHGTGTTLAIVPEFGYTPAQISAQPVQ